MFSIRSSKSECILIALCVFAVAPANEKPIKSIPESMSSETNSLSKVPPLVTNPGRAPISFTILIASIRFP